MENSWFGRKEIGDIMHGSWVGGLDCQWWDHMCWKIALYELYLEDFSRKSFIILPCFGGWFTTACAVYIA
jgi:hypothetical protein